ncbi:MAG: hypothetical protein IKI09_00495, partial [Bacteroidales bacterium]|nr:hypothetical protein [Bacteroidales bacterium]
MKKVLLLLGMLSLSFLDFAQVSMYMRIGTIGEKAVGKLLQYKPESDAIHRKQTERALSLLPSEKSSGNKQSLFPVSELNIQVGENDSVLLSWNVPVG